MRLGCGCRALHGGDVTQTFCWVCRRKVRRLSGAAFARCAWLGAVARIPFVAGIDHYLPPAFGRLHPRWGSPVVALITQAVIAAIFIFLGQGGTSVKGAYDVLVSSTVVITLVPFLFLFAAALKLRGPWGISLAALIGLGTTLAAIIFAGFPADDDPNKPLAVGKVIGLTAAMILSGVAIYALGRRRALALSNGA